jgi:hypothetical protein
LPHQDRLNIAVFIDFDASKSASNPPSGNISTPDHSRRHQERGEVVTKIAYADWTRAGEYSRAPAQHAIRLVSAT